jgi:hypothetical protein
MNYMKLWGIVAAAALLAFAACDNLADNTGHIHQWGEYLVTSPVTCVEPGEQTRTCALDSTHVERVTIYPTRGVGGVHTVEAWRTIRTATDTVDGEEQGVCVECEAEVSSPLYATGTAGLAFTAINNNTAYRVHNGGNKTFTAIHIPAYHRPDENSPYLPVTEIGNGTNTAANNAFGGSNATTSANTALTAITFAENRKPITISPYAFNHCRSINITIPADVTIGNNAFQGCVGITSVTITEDITISGNNAFYGCTGITSVTISPGATISGGGSFYGCTGITEVTIPVGATISGSGTFRGCKGITQATFAAGIKSIPSMIFYGCSNLTTVNIPTSVTSISSYAFQETAISSITIPNGVKSIEDSTFKGCTNLTTVNIPASVTSIGTYAFEASGLTSINIHAGITSIGDSAFHNCTKLTAITVDSGNKNYSSDNYGILYNKAKTTLIRAPGAIESVSIPNTVKVIKSIAFYNCTKLTNVTIPEGVTLIDTSAFQYCTGLTTIDIPRTVTEIGTSAFSYCTNLTAVNFPENSELLCINAQAFYNCLKILEFFVPAKVESFGASVFDSWKNTQTIFVTSYSSAQAAAAEDAWGRSWVPYYNGNYAIVKYLQSDGVTWHDKNGVVTTGPTVPQAAL